MPVEIQERSTRKMRVFSVQAAILGHRTYGELLRRAFFDSPDLDFEAKWITDDLELPLRIINRILWQNVPLAAVTQRNLDLKRFRSECGASLIARRLIARAQRRRPIDVLHFHTQNVAWLSQAYSARIPTVITTDQTNAQLAKEYPSWTRWTHTPGIILERRAVHNAKAIVTFSQWAADSFVREYGLPTERLHVVHVGVSLRQFEVAERRTHGPAIKRLLFVGNDFARKGGPLLIDVFRRRFAGQAVELDVMSNQPGLTGGGGVTVHRNVQAFSPAWQSLYAHADAFVLPTQREPYGIAYIEALAAGLPVIGTRVGAAAEIVSEDVGFLIEPNDAHALESRIRQLLDSEDLRLRFGSNARVRAARLFDAEANAAKLGEIFKAVAAEHAAHRS